MSSVLIPEGVWPMFEKLLPPAPPKPRGGRPRIPDRAALSGILFVLRSGIAWEDLPPELGCGSGVTCWRRLRDWQQAGVWDRLHLKVLRRLHGANRLDFSRVSMDSSSIAAKKGALPRAQIQRIAARRARSAIS
jgi:transposase